MTQGKNLWFHSGAAVRLRARLLVNFESQEFLRWQLFDIRRQVDTSLVLSPLRGPGLPRDTDAHVHTGFLYAFRSVGGRVLDVLREQFEKCPLYDVAVSGKPSCFFSIYANLLCPQVIRLECVGPCFFVDMTYVIVLEQGAIACIAALSIRNTFPDAALRLFTFGDRSRTPVGARCY